jgi:hypothetical protein
MNDGLDAGQGLLDRIMVARVAVYFLKLGMINADRGCRPRQGAQPALSAAWTVARPIPLLAPIIRTAVIGVNISFEFPLAARRLHAAVANSGAPSDRHLGGRCSDNRITMITNISDND